MLPVIQVKDLSKAYQIGEFSTGTMAHDIRRWYIRMRGKEDPYIRIGEVNDRTVKGESPIVWSLRDINFEIEQGDAVGIIGRNGAGKSTLLKILSRVTIPTTGSIKVKGRIASLLEVGTGFHPELTGRENIFLNGSILGMRKEEIKTKFEEIVEFSGVQRYIDTPVKRYSSGMYVRLAFAVAAHLESEILIVDEVLAVGDAEFQKKCLGKMGDVRLKEGRTVIFVSHNIEAINRLCNTAIYLEFGNIKVMGDVDKVSKQYMYSDLGVTATITWPDLSTAPGNDKIRLCSAFVHDQYFKHEEILDVTEPIGISFTFEVFHLMPRFTHGITVYNESEVCIFSSHDLTSDFIDISREPGRYSATAWIPPNLLSEGAYTVQLAAFENYGSVIIHFNELNSVKFTIIDYLRGNSARGVYPGPIPGLIRPLLKWETTKL